MKDMMMMARPCRGIGILPMRHGLEAHATAEVVIS
jgi:hypothetical protein